ncbi:MAG: hypothetical protein ACLVD8_17690 [Enterocloster sp.]|uniref:hypothetical protein n=1 Tax=Enterocloster sp. TaxID=2719315 RepID=UPI000208212B|nr:hypothetical protein HMPREF1025_01360 [Lachnospiraceae bacterium 3_1_46FAA]
MLSVGLKIIGLVFLVIVVICIWKTAEYFNTLPESNKYKPVIAWDLLVLFFVAVALVMKIVSM